jgi:hypothetical protein
MRNLIALIVLMAAAVAVCWSQPQGGVRGVTFEKTSQIYDVECMGGYSQCHFSNDGTLWLDSTLLESKSNLPFRKIECGPGLSCKVEGDELVISGGGGK